MTAETKKQICWWTFIPIGLGIAWIFYAGMKMEKYDTAVSVNCEQQALLNRFEIRITKMETMFERTSQDIGEIKAILKSKP